MPYKVQCRTYKFVLTHMNLCYSIQPGYRIKAAHFSIVQNTNKISVCMVNSTAYQNHNLTEETNSSSSIAKCQSALDDPESSINAGYDVKRFWNLDRITNKKFQGDLLWSPAQQTLLFSASVYGSFITLFFSGYLADKFGPKFLVMGK